MDNIKINVENGELSTEEVNAYVNQIKEKYPDRKIIEITFTVDGEYVDVKTEFEPQPPIERIRRITGYLVGSLNRFNNGKLAEVKDRVPHSYRDEYELPNHAGDV